MSKQNVSEPLDYMDCVVTERFRKDLERYWRKHPGRPTLKLDDVLDELYQDDTGDAIVPPLRDDVTPYIHDRFPGMVFVVSVDLKTDEATVITMRPRVQRMATPKELPEDKPNKKEQRQIERHESYTKMIENLIVEIQALRSQIKGLHTP